MKSIGYRTVVVHVSRSIQTKMMKHGTIMRNKQADRQLFRSFNMRQTDHELEH